MPSRPLLTEILGGIPLTITIMVAEKDEDDLHRGVDDAGPALHQRVRTMPMVPLLYASLLSDILTDPRVETLDMFVFQTTSI